MIKAIVHKRGGIIMNARQMKKYLKKQIIKLQSDNDLMRRIIADSPKMQELYDVYTKPLNVTHTTLSVRKFKARRMIPVNEADDEEIIETTKQLLAKDLFEGIKENIVYEIDTEDRLTSITGSIFIGNK